RRREVATRQEMLRHTEFFQFPRQAFGKESSPHELHLGIRDALLDAGARIEGESLPEATNYWTLTPAGMVGNNVGCEADYMSFSGAIKGSKGRSLPPVFYLILVISLATTAIGVGAVGLLGCAIYAWWISNYHRGKLMARYDGVYRRPASGAETAGGTKNWEFQVDVMLSYHVEMPPFGEAMGPQVVGPVFRHACAAAMSYAANGVSSYRSQPQLCSHLESEYEARFPVVMGSEPGQSMTDVQPDAGGPPEIPHDTDESSA
ncbi:MAG: hypothetical protein VYE15_03115, partial [Myxococcota bacterium]|nr:hypothetical protein [Myxococcota bacterium]